MARHVYILVIMNEEFHTPHLMQLLRELRKQRNELAQLVDECEMQFLRKQDHETACHELLMKQVEVEEQQVLCMQYFHSFDFVN